ncbi:MAG: hypothetical protein ACOZF2_01520 [Thermodesulfobacteriota bacterium]
MPWRVGPCCYTLPGVDRGSEPGEAAFRIGVYGRTRSLFLDVDGGREFKRVAEKSPSQKNRWPV